MTGTMSQAIIAAFPLVQTGGSRPSTEAAIG